MVVYVYHNNNNNGWLSELDIEMIKRKISQENADDVGERGAERVQEKA